MSALVLQSVDREPVPLRLRRVSVAEYHRMIRDGYFAANERFELIDGMILEKMSKNPPHETALNRARKLIERQLAAAAVTVRIQSPVTLADSEPEPDIVVARGTDEDYSARHPGPADVLMLVEVSDATLDLDRGPKLRAYARAGIELYLVVNTPEGVLELYRAPAGDSYAPPQRVAAGSTALVEIRDARVTLDPSAIFGR